jgi:hypothetical protein
VPRTTRAAGPPGLDSAPLLHAPCQ